MTMNYADASYAPLPPQATMPNDDGGGSTTVITPTRGATSITSTSFDGKDATTILPDAASVAGVATSSTTSAAVPRRDDGGARITTDTTTTSSSSMIGNTTTGRWPPASSSRSLPPLAGRVRDLWRGETNDANANDATSRSTTGCGGIREGGGRRKRGDINGSGGGRSDVIEFEVNQECEFLSETMGGQTFLHRFISLFLRPSFYSFVRCVLPRH